MGNRIKAGEGEVWRVLDANANRAREGLRVVEDTARFVLGRDDAAAALRGLRHQLDESVRRHYATLLKHRDVAGDSGRENRSTKHAGGVRSILASNFKRSEEALRVLEEYGRMVEPKVVKDIQKVRFGVYRWEKKLLQS